MDNYIGAREAAAKWNVTVRQVQRICQAGMIPGATLFINAWAIPKNAPKPTRTGKLKPGRKPMNKD
ncbi:MAG: DNA-binding protein [Clostridiales Family XIII bacterium]|jgi:hypothetical protein|nr:DNA-binding protein [Clostridiales Family XIII bacterium]